jgi:hypothetical protein
MIPNQIKIISLKTKIKNNFLKFIENNRRLKFDPKKQQRTISFTSYHIDSYDKELVKLYHEDLDPHIKQYFANYCLTNIWYQIYEAKSGSFHEYHDHVGSESHFSGIYYLKLRSNKISTEFIIDNAPKQFNVKEGDLILFDSRIMHRSPPNTTRHDKIILSFNLNLFL